MRKFPSIIVAMSLTTVGLADATTSVKMNVETVSDYTYTTPGGGTQNDTDANSEGNGFWNALSVTGSGWTASQHWVDQQVWDTDFCDPDHTGYALDNDTTYFDSPGTGISLFVGHGSCLDISNTGCLSDADCPAGSYCPMGSAPPSGTTRVCINQDYKWLYTSSPNSKHSNRVSYGKKYGAVSSYGFDLGESAASGAWRGAGTNGGANVSILVNSCGLRSKYINADANMFAGVHAVMMAMPISAVGWGFSTTSFADTAQWWQRGSVLGQYITANPLAAMSDAWLTPTMVNNGFLSVGSVAAPDGAQVVISKDASQAAAAWHVLNETWVQSRDDAYDATGSGYSQIRYICNYSCNTLGW